MATNSPGPPGVSGAHILQNNDDTELNNYNMDDDNDIPISDDAIMSTMSEDQKIRIFKRILATDQITRAAFNDDLQLKAKVVHLAGGKAPIVPFYNSSANCTNTSISNNVSNMTNPSDKPNKRTSVVLNNDNNEQNASSKRPNNDEFNFPPLRLQCKQTQVLNVNPTSTQNRYENLAEQQLSAPSTIIHETPNTTEKTTPKIKPISILKTDNWKEIIKNIGETVDNDFHVKPAPEFIRIFTNNIDAHRKITQHLKDNNIKCIIFEPGMVRPIKVVIRGLPHDTDINEIKEGLEKQNLTVTKVTQMISRRTETKGKNLPLFLVELPQTTENKTITMINRLNYIGIKIENYRTPNRVLQCFRCQHFHHTQNECFMDYRCVKCSGPHDSRDCPNGAGRMKDQEALKCCNCGLKHPANFEGCNKYPKVKNVNRITPSRPVDKATSFAAITRNSTQQENPTAPNVNKPQANRNTHIRTSNEEEEITIIKLAKVVNKIESQLQNSNLGQLLSVFEKMLANMEGYTNIEDKALVLIKALPQILPTVAK